MLGSEVFSFFAYFLGLFLIEYEHVQKLFIFLNGNSPSVFEAQCLQKKVFWYVKF